MSKHPSTRKTPNTPQTKTSTTSRLSASTAEPAPKRLTFAAVKAGLAAIGVRITPPHDGDYRVVLQGGDEASAYYTDDLADALGTGRVMKEQGATVRHLQDYSATCDGCGATQVSVTPQGYCLRCASKRERATVAHQEAVRDENRLRIAREDREWLDGAEEDEEPTQAQESKTWTTPVTCGQCDATADSVLELAKHWKASGHTTARVQMNSGPRRRKEDQPGSARTYFTKADECVRLCEALAAFWGDCCDAPIWPGAYITEEDTPIRDLIRAAVGLTPLGWKAGAGDPLTAADARMRAEDDRKTPPAMGEGESDMERDRR